ncbi:methyl-accepting chemotaxis protein [Halobacillus sp. A1]|uniref:methyl-accepting chemotaxis protein n=1 Tax=Halobacillus sp. A1 TaxID=2880262 RepID=UPI0020A62A28|nr:methyl-accepting chemotaxis protein [Halobacillus sp. A1]MCP3030964.1 methyl-accepting chemotaxis protein [Halobacillus sp. A1]
MITLMSGIFAVQHLTAMFAGTEFVYGSPDYSWVMFALHAFYLVLTSAGTSFQVYKKNVFVDAIQAEQSTIEAQLTQMLSNVEKASLQVLDTVKVLHHSSHDSSDASAHVNSIIEKMNVNSQSHTQKAEESMLSIKEIQQGIEQMTQSTAAVSEAASETKRLAVKGKDSLDQTSREMSFIQETMDDTSDIIISLKERSKDIGSMSAEITSITERTNLLALNAAIEAARAGEAGKGFSVVAQEVRTLASQSEKAAANISSIVEEIQAQISNAVFSSDQSKVEMEEGNETIKDTQSLFERIVESTEKVERQIQEVSAASEELFAGSEQAARSFLEFASFARDAETQNGEIAAS